ncbi:aspartate/glutamate racemase family protein [Micromonospora sp. NPDC000089]|uniref:aspartate/glutamate racemase family protein n=1 Tax=unclassified Micromonospora TaxID=2617518 RepID=UPI00369CC25C
MTAPIVGVLGGMGPLASAEFVRSIYAPPLPVEQDCPRVLLWSDPAVTDRTTAIAQQEVDELTKSVAHAVEQLLSVGAQRVVVACVTAHVAVRRLAPELAERCISPVDVIFEELALRRRPHLLLCTLGSIRAGIFTSHHRWPELGRHLVLPEPADAQRVHDLAYEIKRGGTVPAAGEFVREALTRYGVTDFVAGCTEFHLVTRATDLPNLDPLTTMAARIREGKL